MPFPHSAHGEQAGKRKRLEWIFLITAGVFLYILAVYGWWATIKANGGHLDWLEILHNGLETLVGKEFVLIDHPPIPPSQALSIAGFGAKLLLGLALIKGALAAFHSQIENFKFGKVKGHTILCGAGERGDALARRLLERGEKVALVEIDSDNSHLGELRSLGAHVVVGNAMDIATLQDAGLSRARSLVAVTTKDQSNLAICREATTHAGCPARAGVESFEMRSYFKDNIPVAKAGASIALVSFQCRAARQLLLELATEMVKDKAIRDKGVHLLVEADDVFREEILRAAALMLQISGDVRPRFDVTRVGTDDKDRFETRFPESRIVVDIRWHETHAEAVLPEHGEHHPDVAIFALESDVLTLEAAERFRIRHKTPGSRIVACLRSTSELYSLALATRKNQKEGILIKNLFGLGFGSDDPLDYALDKEAAQLHLDYCRIAKSSDPKWNKYPEEWEKLDELTRDSNRLQAAHHIVKRAAWASKDTDHDEDLLIHLARSEHMRWMAEKAMDGWRGPGAENPERREDKLRIHNLLVPYDALSLIEKDKDLNPILKALGLPERKS